jgi:DNA-binding NarL/FixJ family response regulator
MTTVAMPHRAGSGQEGAVRVLLVEDDVRTRRSVRWVLEAAGLVVEVPDHVPLADAAGGYDVIVLDVTAAGRGELTALEELAMAGTSTPRVVFSVHAQPYLRSVAAALGAAAFLDRASDEADLLVEVVEAVAREAAAP